MAEFLFQGIINRNNESDSLTDEIYSLIPKEWSIIDENPWLMVMNKESRLLTQGWKGHISAVLWDATQIAEIAIPILVKKQCSFKIVKSKKLLTIINDIHFPVSGANKYITFYPQSEEIFKECIHELYYALKKFNGPRIHTDFQCGLNGIVHFRYGGFTKITKYDIAQNKIIHCIKNDKGQLIEDERNPWYEKPEWVKDPFDGVNDFHNSLELSDEDIEKINKYEFISILSRSNKGNVYLAKMRSNGEEIIIKESNPYVFFGDESSCAKEVLRNEYNILKIMKHTGVVPKIYDLFTCGNKCYMVEEKINGLTMTKYVMSNNIKDYTEKIDLVYKIIDTVELFHKKGYVLRDLKLDNIIVTPEKELKFIDLESVCEADITKRIYSIGTYGFYNPEFNMLNPDMRNDWYATIISILSLIGGSIPFFQNDSSNGFIAERSVMSKLASYVEELRNDEKLSEKEYKIIVSIINDKIGINFNTLLLKNKEALKNASIEYITNYAIEGLYRQCENSYNNSEKRLWKSTEFGNTTNVFNIQHGIAGVGEFLVKYLEKNNDTNEFAEKTLLIISKFIKENISSFIEHSMDKASDDIERGFLFGSSGIAWFLHDLGTYLKDEDILKYSRILADISDNEEKIDFALGKAGRVYADLKFWIETKERKYYDRAINGAKFLINESEELKAVSNKHVEKVSNYGFAHGYAGIAYIVYMVGVMDNNNSYKEYAMKKVNLILDSYEKLLENKENEVSISWCNGISGIFLALVRINQFENNERISKLLSKVPKVLIDKMWQQSPCQCHGNTSSIEFLMDAYQITGEEIYYVAAERIAKFVKQQFFYGKNHSILFPSESKLFDVYDYGVGTMGVIQALNRVNKNNSRRLFMIDDVELIN